MIKYQLSKNWYSQTAPGFWSSLILEKMRLHYVYNICLPRYKNRFLLFKVMNIPLSSNTCIRLVKYKTLLVCNLDITGFFRTFNTVDQTSLQPIILVEIGVIIWINIVRNVCILAVLISGFSYQIFKIFMLKWPT